MCSIPDLAYSCFFLGIFIFLKIKNNSIKNEAEEVDIVPSSYSIEVTGLPSNFNDES